MNTIALEYLYYLSLLKTSSCLTNTQVTPESKRKAVGIDHIKFMPLGLKVLYIYSTEGEQIKADMLPPDHFFSASVSEL